MTSTFNVPKLRKLKQKDLRKAQKVLKLSKPHYLFKKSKQIENNLCIVGEWT